MTTPTHPTSAPHGTDHPMTPTDTVTSDAVRAALVELLTTGQYHHAATPATLTAVGATRAALDQQHGTTDPAARHAPPDRRLAALTAALGVVGAALFAATPWQPLDTTALRTGLRELPPSPSAGSTPSPPHHRNPTPTTATTARRSSPPERTTSIMAGLPDITLAGTLVADPELRFTPTGTAVATFTVAANDRRYDPATAQWTDNGATFLRYSIWRQTAEHVAKSLTKGTRVLLTGTLRQRAWDSANGANATPWKSTSPKSAPP